MIDLGIAILVFVIYFCIEEFNKYLLRCCFEELQRSNLLSVDRIKKEYSFGKILIEYDIWNDNPILYYKGWRVYTSDIIITYIEKIITKKDWIDNV